MKDGPCAVWCGLSPEHDGGCRRSATSPDPADGRFLEGYLVGVNDAVSAVEQCSAEPTADVRSVYLLAIEKLLEGATPGELLQIRASALEARIERHARRIEAIERILPARADMACRRLDAVEARLNERDDRAVVVQKDPGGT